MIRLVYHMHRRSGTSLEEFKHHFREEYGELVIRHSAALGIRRYVQSYALLEPIAEAMRKARGGMEKPFDGVAETWWNNADDALVTLRSPQGLQVMKDLATKEQEFVDIANSAIWFGIELPQVNPTPENIVAKEHSTIIRLVFPLRPRSNITFEQFQLDWRMNHGPLVRSLAPAIRALRYFQVHRYPCPLDDLVQGPRGKMAEPHAGHAELWLDRLQLGGTTPEGRRAAATLLEDEARFIDFSRSTMWLAKEQVLVDKI